MTDTALAPHEHPTAEAHLALVLDTYHETHRYDSEDLIRRAYDRAAAAHANQRRLSGEPYIHHPLAVAHILARFGFDDKILAAALLHDVLEDTDESREELEEAFGSDVAFLVDGLTKLDRLKLADRTTQQVTALRKMLVTMARDLRVLFIKFADRLHNMQTIAALPLDRQESIAAETLQVYAPLADRLGMEQLKTQLEDLSFSVLHPKWYAEIDHLVEERSPEREIYLTQVIAQIQGRLNEVIINAEVTGRPKHLWSIFDKMQKKELQFDQIHDLIGIRVITESVQDCYAALGTVHAIWKPAQGRFKDYISMPKFNLYQSLHTTVVGPAGKLLEVQIRTEVMHKRAEYGVAAHWDYKEENGELLWLSRLMDWTQEADEPAEATMSNLTEALALEEVYAFTPMGEIVTLPTGATPVDFAYSIHTEVGHRCVGAKINGRLSALNSKLVTGDTVEIFTSKSPDAGPSRDWLSFIVTHRARNRIRQWHARERRAESAATGRDEVMTALRKEPLAEEAAAKLLPDVAGDLGFQNVDDLFVAVYRGQFSGQSIVNRILRRHKGDAAEEEAAESDLAQEQLLRPYPPEGEAPAASRGIHVEGQSDMFVRISKCCTPVPHDDIIGFVTRGRGVSIHRSDCSNAVSLAETQKERCIAVEWSSDHDEKFIATMEVKAFDRQNLLSDVSSVLSEHNVNIVKAETNTARDGISTMRFDVELADNAQIRSLLQQLRRIEYVYSATRVLPQAGREAAAEESDKNLESGGVK